MAAKKNKPLDSPLESLEISPLCVEESNTFMGGFVIFNQFDTHDFPGKTPGFLIAMVLLLGCGGAGIYFIIKKPFSPSNGQKTNHTYNNPIKKDNSFSSTINPAPIDNLNEAIPKVAGKDEFPNDQSIQNYNAFTGSPKHSKTQDIGLTASPETAVKKEEIRDSFTHSFSRQAMGTPRMHASSREESPKNTPDKVENKLEETIVSLPVLSESKETLNADVPTSNIVSIPYAELKRGISSFGTWKPVLENNKMYTYESTNLNPYAEADENSPSKCIFQEVYDIPNRRFIMVPRELPGFTYKLFNIEGDEVTYIQKLPIFCVQTEHQCNVKLADLVRWVRGETTGKELQETYKTVPRVFSGKSDPSRFIFKTVSPNFYCPTKLPSDPGYLLFDPSNKEAIVYRNPASGEQVITDSERLYSWMCGIGAGENLIKGGILPREINPDKNMPASVTFSTLDVVTNRSNQGFWVRKSEHGKIKFYFHPFKPGPYYSQFDCMKAMDKASKETYMVPAVHPNEPSTKFEKIKDGKAIYQHTWNSSELSLSLNKLNDRLKGNITQEELIDADAKENISSDLHADVPASPASSIPYAALRRETNPGTWKFSEEHGKIKKYIFMPTNPTFYSKMGATPSGCKFIEVVDAANKEQTIMVPNESPGNSYIFSKIEDDKAIYEQTLPLMLKLKKYQCSINLNNIADWVQGKMTGKELEITYEGVPDNPSCDDKHPSRFVYLKAGDSVCPTKLPSDPNFLFYKAYSNNVIVYQDQKDGTQMLINELQLGFWRCGMASPKDLLAGKVLKPISKSDIMSTSTINVSDARDVLMNCSDEGFWIQTFDFWLSDEPKIYFQPFKPGSHYSRCYCVTTQDEVSGDTYRVPALYLDKSLMRFKEIKGEKAVYQHMENPSNEHSLCLNMLNCWLKGDVSLQELILADNEFGLKPI